MAIKKNVEAINLIVLALIIGVVIYFSVYYSPQPQSSPTQKNCVSLSLDPSFSFDSCYDAHSKTIFLKMKRGYDSYELSSIDFSFFDFSSKNFEVYEVPQRGGSKTFKIPAEKNPENLNVVIKSSAPEDNLCPTPKIIFVNYCSGSDNLTLSVSSGGSTINVVQVDSSSDLFSDTFSMDLVDRERVWDSQCTSDWQCGSWGPCENGVQRRDCIDLNHCPVSAYAEQTTKFCDSACAENWQCTWSKCSAGYSVPDCKDLNDCGTSFNKPSKINCDSSFCTPNVVCGEWSDCRLDYQFTDLLDFQTGSLSGIKTRTCIDKNFCANPAEESQQCSLSVDVYTKIIKSCGKEYLGIFNRLDDTLIAKVDKGSASSPYLDIVLGGDEEYCDYCYDGVKDGDETGIDCGGSCKKC